MKYSLYIFIALVIGLFAYFGIYKEKSQPISDQKIERSTNAVKQSLWETKIDDRPPVIVKVTPIKISEKAEEWKFDIVFDTHSGSLDENPIEIASLTDDKGNEYKPTAWEGSGPGGHHREGILIFNPVEQSPEYVELKIKNIGGVPERSFKWNLK